MGDALSYAHVVIRGIGRSINQPLWAEHSM